MKLEESMKRLEEIAQILDSGEKSLEECLKLYEEGVKLAKACLQSLEKTKTALDIFSSAVFILTRNGKEGIIAV
jgi:exodeoxyribonuclease VII small subunit